MVVNQVSNLTSADASFFSPRRIEKLASRCVRLLQGRRLRNQKFFSRGELTIVLLSPVQMQKINFQFRKKNKPTDVLSFPSASEHSLGEILLCPSILKKQARTHQVSVQNELTLMLTHGILHLLGYDHEISGRDDQMMKRHQDFVLKSFDLESR